MVNLTTKEANTNISVAGARLAKRVAALTHRIARIKKKIEANTRDKPQYVKELIMREAELAYKGILDKGV